MRVLFHTQHLSGVGHFVCAHAIATGLAEAHDVHLVDGGRLVPRAATGVEPRRVRLPRLARTPEGHLLAVEGGSESPERTLARRADLLAKAARAIRPDVVLVEHFPFSKWELDHEIITTLAAARRANPNVRVVCSLRDIAPRTRYEDVTHEEHAERVLGWLEEWFDGLLVHADPAFTRLEEHFPRAPEIPVRLAYTGFVTEPAPAVPEVPWPWAVLSSGGLNATAFLVAAISAFCVVAKSGALGPMRLQVFSGLGAGTGDAAALEQAARAGPVDVHEFSTSFSAWLHGAALSISRAGYNTSAALLRSRVPAVLVPDSRMSDQRPRAQRLVKEGLAVAVEAERERDVDALAAAINAALAAPPPHHSFDLSGVATTRRLVEESVMRENSWVSGATATPKTRSDRRRAV